MSTTTENQIRPHARAARELRRRARRDPPARHRRPRRARRRLHPQGDQAPSAGSRSPAARCCCVGVLPARLARRHRRPLALQDPRQHGDRPQRDARPVRLDGRPGALRQELRVGHRLPRRPVAPLPQLHAPHPHQHRRQGPRHRLRRPAHVRGPAVAPLLPGQPASTRSCWRCFFQYGVALHDLEVERIVDRRGDAGRQAQDAAARSGSKVRRQTLKDYVLFPALVRARCFLVHPGRQRDRQPGPQRLVVHDHLLRPLPGRHPRVHRGGDRGRDPRPVVLPPAARLGEPHRRQALPHPRPATSATRSSTTCSPTCRPTATPEISVEVREICERYGIPYNTGPLRKQFGSVVRKICRLALPDRRSGDRRPVPGERRRRGARAGRGLISPPYPRP